MIVQELPEALVTSSLTRAAQPADVEQVLDFQVLHMIEDDSILLGSWIWRPSRKFLKFKFLRQALWVCRSRLSSSSFLQFSIELLRKLSTCMFLLVPFLRILWNKWWMFPGEFLLVLCLRELCNRWWTFPYAVKFLKILCLRELWKRWWTFPYAVKFLKILCLRELWKRLWMFPLPVFLLLLVVHSSWMRVLQPPGWVLRRSNSKGFFALFPPEEKVRKLPGVRVRECTRTPPHPRQLLITMMLCLVMTVGYIS